MTSANLKNNCSTNSIQNIEEELVKKQELTQKSLSSNNLFPIKEERNAISPRTLIASQSITANNVTISPERFYNSRSLLVSEDRLDGHVNLTNEEDKKTVIEILSKHSLRRFPQELFFLRKAFKDIKFFAEIEKELEEKYFMELFRKLQFEKFEPGDAVFNHGETGRKFYIIIKGSVYVLLRDKGIAESNTKESYFMRSVTLQSDELKTALIEREKLREALNNSNVADEEKKALVEEQNPNFWVVRTMNSGDSFGEIALQAEGDRKRTATIICRAPTLFGVLTRESYNEILDDIIKRKTSKKIEFFQKIDFFKHWNHSDIASLVIHVEEKTFKRNNIIFEEGELPQELYFIQDGEIELRKNISANEMNQHQGNVKRSQTMRNLKSTKFNTSKQIRVTYKHVKLIFKLAILSDNDYFGEVEILDNKLREYSAVVVSASVKIVSIARDKFLKFVKDHKSLEKFRLHLKLKQELHKNLSENFKKIHIPNLNPIEYQKSNKIESKIFKKPSYLNFPGEVSSKSTENQSTFNLPTLLNESLNLNVSKSISTNNNIGSSLLQSLPTLSNRSDNNPASRRIIPNIPIHIVKRQVNKKYQKIKFDLKKSSMEEDETGVPLYSDIDEERIADEDFNFIKKGAVPITENSNQSQLLLVKKSKTVAERPSEYVNRNAHFNAEERKESKLNAITNFKSNKLTSTVIRSLKLDKLLIKSPIDKILTTRNEPQIQSDISSVEKELHHMITRNQNSLKYRRTTSLHPAEDLSIPSIEIKTSEVFSPLNDRLRFILEKH